MDHDPQSLDRADRIIQVKDELRELAYCQKIPLILLKLRRDPISKTMDKAKARAHTAGDRRGV
ncbi:MAG: hypothetical protein AAF685_06185 [Cyanobacteria bacterium P01_C01_bin.89]